MPQYIENIDSFYEGLQYAHLSESEKTSILLSIFEKNLKKENNLFTVMLVNILNFLIPHLDFTNILLKTNY